MKKNEEKILKYLSEMLTNEERKQFEIELSRSYELKKELDAIQNRFVQFRYLETENADERYFASLLPKVYSRIEQNVNPIKKWKVALAAPSFVAIIVLAILIFRPNGYNTMYKDLAQEVIDNIFDEDVSQLYVSEIDITDEGNILTSQLNNYDISPIDDSAKENILTAYDYLIDDDILYINNLSDNELKQLQNKINSAISY